MIRYETRPNGINGTLVCLYENGVFIDTFKSEAEAMEHAEWRRPKVQRNIDYSRRKEELNRKRQRPNLDKINSVINACRRDVENGVANSETLEDLELALQCVKMGWTPPKARNNVRKAYDVFMKTS